MRSPDKEREPFVSLAFANGLFVAGGMHGVRMTSKDGLRWENRATGEIGEHINEIVWTERGPLLVRGTYLVRTARWLGPVRNSLLIAVLIVILILLLR